MKRPFYQSASDANQAGMGLFWGWLILSVIAMPTTSGHLLGITFLHITPLLADGTRSYGASLHIWDHSLMLTVQRPAALPSA